MHHPAGPVLLAIHRDEIIAGFIEYALEVIAASACLPESSFCSASTRRLRVCAESPRRFTPSCPSAGWTRTNAPRMIAKRQRRFMEPTLDAADILILDNPVAGTSTAPRNRLFAFGVTVSGVHTQGRQKYACFRDRQGWRPYPRR